MLAGWLASIHKIFSYNQVIIVTICGAFIGDLSIFLFGRIFEKKALDYLNKNPQRKEKIENWIQKYGYLL